MASELDLDFTTGSVPSGIAVTRSGSAWHYNASGVLTLASANTARIDYDRDTLALRGFLIEEPRTQSIQNATGSSGLVAGTPGTVPSRWVQQANATGVTRTVIGSGTLANGHPYVDLQYSGTATASDAVLFFESSTGVATVNATTWTSSLHIALIGGSLTNVTCKQGLRFRAAAGASLGAQIYETSFVPTSTLTRFERTATGSDATIAFVAPSLTFTCATGAVDLTVRISIPQLELGAFATSPIVTTNAGTITRQGDVTNISSGTFWNATEGTLHAEFHSPKQTSLTATSVVFGASNGAFTETIYLSASTTSDSFSVQDGGVQQAGLGATSPPLTAKRIVGAYKANDFAFYRNGGSSSLDGSGTVPTGMSQWRIGIQAWGGGSANYLNGWIRRIRYWPVRYPNADLISLSSAPVSITGTGGSTLDDLTSAASGNHIEPTTGTAASTLDALAGDATGSTVAGTGAASLEVLVGDAAGISIIPIAGSGSATLAELLAVSADGWFLVYGEPVQELEALASTAAGNHVEEFVLAFAVQELEALASGGSGAHGVGCSSAATLEALASSADGLRGAAGTGAPILATLTSDALGWLPVAGSGAPALSDLSAYGFGSAYAARRVRSARLTGRGRTVIPLNATVRQ